MEDAFQLLLLKGVVLQSMSSICRPEFLRRCPDCVKSDRQQYGEAYWHRLHQVPGVRICPIHDCVLEDSAVPAHKLTSFITAEAANRGENVDSNQIDSLDHLIS